MLVWLLEHDRACGALGSGLTSTCMYFCLYLLVRYVVAAVLLVVPSRTSVVPVLCAILQVHLPREKVEGNLMWM